MNETQSEFPETKFGKIGKKIGWLFSPILLISLIFFTLFWAEGLKVNFEKGSIEKKASIEIKEIKDAVVYIDGEERGKTPDFFDITTFEPEANENTIQIRKQDKREWMKKVKVDQGFVNTYYPILYPNEIKFTTDIKNIENVYQNEDSSTFFYEKKNQGKIELHRYSVSRQLFGIRESNTLFADITKYVLNTPTEENPDATPTLKSYNILVSNNNQRLLLIIPNEGIYVIQKEGNISKIPNVNPKPSDEFLWSPTDSHIIYNSSEGLYSIELSSNNSLVVIQKPKDAKEKIEIEFLLDSSLIYKLEDEEKTDLVQNSYEGNDFRTIEIPNINGIRKKNLLKAYDLLSKQNLILIQTNTDIYSFNVISFELKKFNRFKGEEVIFTDSEKEVVLTINTTNPREYRYYDLSQNESRTFVLNNKAIKTKPEDIVVFNQSHHMALEFPNLLILSDIDGSNQIEITNFRDPNLVLAAKYDESIQIAIEDEKIVSATPTPSITPTSKEQEGINFLKFQN